MIILQVDMVLDCLSCKKFRKFCLVTNCQHHQISLLWGWYHSGQLQGLHWHRNGAWVSEQNRPSLLSLLESLARKVMIIISSLNIKILSAMFGNRIFWLPCLAFILLPQGLLALYWIVRSIEERPGCGDALLGVFVALMYPLLVPELSIIFSAGELFLGDDEKEVLTFTKALKMFEHLGQYFLFSIL